MALLQGDEVATTAIPGGGSLLALSCARGASRARQPPGSLGHSSCELDRQITVGNRVRSASRQLSERLDGPLVADACAVITGHLGFWSIQRRERMDKLIMPHRCLLSELRGRGLRGGWPMVSIAIPAGRWGEFPNRARRIPACALRSAPKTKSHVARISRWGHR